MLNESFVHYNTSLAYSNFALFYDVVKYLLFSYMMMLVNATIYVYTTILSYSEDILRYSINFVVDQYFVFKMCMTYVAQNLNDLYMVVLKTSIEAKCIFILYLMMKYIVYTLYKMKRQEHRLYLNSSNTRNLLRKLNTEVKTKNKIILKQEAEITASNAEIAANNAEIIALYGEIEKLKSQVCNLKSLNKKQYSDLEDYEEEKASLKNEVIKAKKDASEFQWKWSSTRDAVAVAVGTVSAAIPFLVIYFTCDKDL